MIFGKPLIDFLSQQLRRRLLGAPPLVQQALNPFMEPLYQARRVVAEHESELEQIARKYAGWSTLAGKCDRNAAEQAIVNVYTAVGLEAPTFLWFDSPLKAHSAAMLRLVHDTIVALPTTTKSPPELVANDVVRAIRASNFKIAPFKTAFIKYKVVGLSSTDEVRLDFTPFLQPLFQRSGFARHHLALNLAIMQGLRMSLDENNLRHVQAQGFWQSVDVELTKAGVLSAEWGHQPKALSTLPEMDQRTILEAALLETGARDDMFPSLRWFARRYFLSPADAESMAEMECRQLLGEELGPAFPTVRDTMALCGQWWPSEKVCIIVDRPIEIHFDQNMRLHRINEPAIVFADGWNIYCLRNIVVSESIARGGFSVGDIDSERNLELRRVMIERYGVDRYLKDGGAEEIQRDKYGVLFRKNIPGDEPLLMVAVDNSSPEPDGSYKQYFLRVPPNIRTSREAVAWTFGMGTNEYSPDTET